MRGLALIFSLLAACAAASAATRQGSAAGQSHAAKTTTTQAKDKADKAADTKAAGTRKKPPEVKATGVGKRPVTAAPVKAVAGKGPGNRPPKAKSAGNGKGVAKAARVKAVGGKGRFAIAIPDDRSRSRTAGTGKALAGGQEVRAAAHTLVKPAAAMPAAIGTKTARAAPTGLDEMSSRMGIEVGHLSVVKPGMLRAQPVTRATDGGPVLSSRSVLVVDQSRNQVLFERNSDTPRSIASITKLMTAMVVLDADLPPDEVIRIADQDMDRLKGSSSRLRVGTALPREAMLHLALVASDNRAASALSRHYPGGKAAFVDAMNRKAAALGMTATHFDDPTGLNPNNTSTARDLQRMAQAAYAYPTIRAITSSPHYVLSREDRPNGVEFRNTNRLLRDDGWTIGLSKTGYIQEAGRCLVMQAAIADRPMLIVLLQGQGRGAHFADAVRLRKWLESETVAAAPQYTPQDM